MRTRRRNGRIRNNGQVISEHSPADKTTENQSQRGAGLFGNAGQASYAAAKEGIRGLSRVAATEWGKDGINVNIVCPLAFTAQLENFKATYPEAYEKNLKAVPAGRFGDPEQDIGRVCVHLGSPDFKYMSGETITLEGGLGQRP